MKASGKAHVATVANTPDEFSKALSDPDSDWVYLRHLPLKEEIVAARRAGKKAFVAGPAVAGRLPEYWVRVADVGIDAILLDYPLELRATLTASGKVERSKKWPK
ncbi:MAG TPA: hypothetical protein VMV10_15195 [Pirellulales bacterium]|nr:hypothetical protein [Pirellulales bacterium]